MGTRRINQLPGKKTLLHPIALVQLALMAKRKFNSFKSWKRGRDWFLKRLISLAVSVEREEKKKKDKKGM